jgi:hypothetical protein
MNRYRFEAERLSVVDAVGALGERELAMRGAELMQGDPDLLQVVDALQPTARFPGVKHGWDGDREEKADDGDRDQRLDQGEAARTDGLES